MSANMEPSIHDEILKLLLPSSTSTPNYSRRGPAFLRFMRILPLMVRRMWLQWRLDRHRRKMAKCAWRLPK